MSKQLLIALANAASALANVALQVAQQEVGTATLEVTQPEPEPTPAPAPRTRGRPRKEAAVKEPEPETTAATEEETSTPPAKEETSTPAKEEIKGKTLDELKAIIKPAVEAGKGAKVKAIIAKYAGEGKILKDLAELPEHHEAFEKDIKALTPVDAEDDF